MENDPMKPIELNANRTQVAAIHAALDQHAGGTRLLERAVALKQTELDAHQAKRPALEQQLADANARLAKSEEAALESWCVDLAAATVKLHNDDPLGNSAAVVANIVKLRAAVRSEIDTPINQKYKVHPLVHQALALQPPPDVWDTPIDQLHGGSISWPVRRKTILAEAFPESNPLQAA
jgi:hypothetical protein